jgi:hypothetical protein
MKDVLDGEAVAGGQIGAEKVSLVAPNQFLGFFADGAGRDLVHEQDALVAVDHEHHVREDLEHRGQPESGLGEKLLDLGDVHHDGRAERIVPPKRKRCDEMADGVLVSAAS